MKVLVAGGTGFIGTNLCAELAERGHDVTALSRNPGQSGLPAGVDTAVGDVNAYDSITDTVAAHDAVVNLVSLSPLFQPPSGLDHETVHLGGTENLVRAAEAGDTDRFVQMSGLDADPNAPTAFLRAKGRAEEEVQASSLEWTIFRPSVVFGDGAEFVEFTKTLTTPYLTGLPGGGDTRFQPIWVGDLAPMLADALEDDGHVGEIYEVAGPEVLTLADVTELAYEAEGRSVTVLPIPMALAKVGLTVVDPVPIVPFGADQGRSLQVDNTVATNDVTAFDRTESELLTLPEYLGLTGRRPK
ncbi:complex I NDUFA9 subunit family protein [Natrarchaeobaculum aegyptiacum]|uniref:Complex I NDUFA9 subunit family protein n=1 Tax=Natrarchaeobaculum aegyptiacum TaxID=745377 RepID=A0A2Z2HX07_9EURY|nr:complex I NDUFA9 subunit family protein [Natrarchaeobaculum aegyptiacum]ARS91919.1 complex I NDUFA9 subunit family protein [Natrarchaeobaculum aegyptiacum]